MSSDASQPGTPRFAVVFRGYDRRQVDEHVGRLQRVIARMRADLTARIQQGDPPGYRPLQQGPGWLGPGLPPPPGEPDAIGGFTDRMQQILQAAEEEAAEIRDRARAETARLRAQVEDLARQRDHILRELAQLRGQRPEQAVDRTAALPRPGSPTPRPRPAVQPPGAPPPTAPAPSPAGRPPADHQPPDHQPPGHQPRGHQPPGHQPPGHQPPGAQPAGPTSARLAPAGSSPAGSSPVGSSPVGSSPVGSSPAGSSPAGLSSARTLAAGPSPAGPATPGPKSGGSAPAGSPPVGRPEPSATQRFDWAAAPLWEIAGRQSGDPAPGPDEATTIDATPRPSRPADRAEPEHATRVLPLPGADQPDPAAAAAGSSPAEEPRRSLHPADAPHPTTGALFKVEPRKPGPAEPSGGPPGPDPDVEQTVLVTAVGSGQGNGGEPAAQASDDGPADVPGPAQETGDRTGSRSPA